MGEEPSTHALDALTDAPTLPPLVTWAGIAAALADVLGLAQRVFFATVLAWLTTLASWTRTSLAEPGRAFRTPRKWPHLSGGSQWDFTDPSPTAVPATPMFRRETESGLLFSCRNSGRQTVLTTGEDHVVEITGSRTEPGWFTRHKRVRDPLMTDTAAK